MKKAKKKGTPSAKTLRGRRSAPSKPFRLEVGRLYQNVSGSLVVRITENRGGTFGMVGEVVKRHPNMRVTTPLWTAEGSYYWHVPDAKDLVREVQPKSPKGRGK